MFNKESAQFSDTQISIIEKNKNAQYVGDTEYKGNLVSVFYGDTPHPVSGSRYFAIYYDTNREMMITNGAFIEDQNFVAVMSDDGEIIYSRYRHDMRYSKDGYVFIDGGRDYHRTNAVITLNYVVRDGKFQLAK